ncbi:hypothetical protein [Qipengyuania nanhaisediminis]|uniref:hypothetical protein n=1 Tax=Qipengyuania nanhaisediminis TaxID=604088 RepID=UPI0038B40E74
MTEGSGDAASDSAASTPAAEQPPTEEEAGTEIAMAGTAWLTVGTDGAVQTTFVDEDGRYRDFRNSEPFGQGSWEQRPDGTICFEPDSGTGACWEIEPDGSETDIFATDSEGRRIDIKRITYAPPQDDEDG